jgi:hypothetical protein
MTQNKRLGIVSLDILNECYSILNELLLVTDNYNYDLKREKKIRNKMKKEANIHSAELESCDHLTRYLKEDISNLNLGYRYAKKKFKGKLNSTLFRDLIDIIDTSEGVSTLANPYPHKMRLNGDPRIFLRKPDGTTYPYIPPTSNIKERLEDYVNFANDGLFSNKIETLDYFRKHNKIKRNSKITDLEKALLTHFHIATIHPFFDGNGRLSRLMQTVMLEKEGFSPGYVPEGEKIFYCNILSDAQVIYKKRTQNYFRKLRENKPITQNEIKTNYCYISNKEHLFFDYLASKVLIGLKSIKKQQLK